MAKYIFTRPNGPWQYPTLGITATLNDVIEANAAPDLWWELTDSGATVTLPAIPAIPGVVEPLDGAIGRWNRQTNEVEFVAQLPDENLPDRLQEAALASTIGSVTKLIPLSSYLAPGQAMPNDGIADAGTLLNTAVNDLIAKANGPQPFGQIRYVLDIGPGLFRHTIPIQPSGSTTKKWFGVKGAGKTQTFLLPEGATTGFLFNNPTDPATPSVAMATFEDFTIDLKNATLGPSGESRKGFIGRGFEDCWFARVDVNNSPATAFGCDFPVRTTFTDCSVTRTGLGADGDLPLPNGLIDAAKYHSGFGLGFGVFPNESVLFDNCSATDCYRGGFFFEMFEAADGYTNRDASIRMVGCRSIGNRIGIINVGSSGVTAVNCQITDNELAGYMGGLTAVTNPYASYNTTLDNCEIARNGYGIYAIGDPSNAPHNYIYLRDILGGYRIINCRIEDNTLGGLVAERFRRIEAGGLTIRGNHFRRNGGGGITLKSQNLNSRDLVIDGNYFDANDYYGISLLVALNAPAVTNNTFVNSDGGTTQTTGIIWHPAEPVSVPRVTGNTFRQMTYPMVNALRFDQTYITGNRTVDATQDASSLRTFVENFFGGSGAAWPVSGWTKHSSGASEDWVRAAPGIAITASTSRALVYKSMPTTAAYVEVDITGSLSGTAARSEAIGVMLALDAGSAQTAIIAGVNGADATLGTSNYYSVWTLVAGTPTLLWQSTVPMLEAHTIALARSLGSTFTDVFIDGRKVYSVDIPAVAASTRYGVFSIGGVTNQDRYVSALRANPYAPDVAPVTVRNKATNPSFEVSGGASVQGGTGGTAGDTRPSDAPNAHGGSYTHLATWSVATTDPVGGGYRITTFEDVTVGIVYTYSIWVKSSRARRYRLNLTYFNATLSGGTSTGSKNGSYVDVPADTWTRLSVTSDAMPAGTVSARMDISAAATANGGTNFQVGDTLRIDDYMCTEGATLYDFFDGARNGGTWTGTADASASTKTI